MKQNVFIFNPEYLTSVSEVTGSQNVIERINTVASDSCTHLDDAIGDLSELIRLTGVDGKIGELVKKISQAVNSAMASTEELAGIVTGDILNE